MKSRTLRERRGIEVRKKCLREGVKSGDGFFSLLSCSTLYSFFLGFGFRFWNSLINSST